MDTVPSRPDEDLVKVLRARLVAREQRLCYHTGAMPPTFRIARVLARVLLGLIAALGLLAVAWRWHPGQSSPIIAPDGSQLLAAASAPLTFLLPAPAPPA